MRTIRLSILLILSFFLIACTPGERIIPESAPDATGWVEIDADALSAKIAAADDFILVVSSETCLSCEAFRPILEDMVSTYGIVVYKIEAGAAFPADNSAFAYRFTPTVAVFRDGAAVAQVDPDRLERPFESVERLVDWLDAYVVFPVLD
ncbi:MAG: hypothetical protein WC509_03265 [Candidatus Izemoplasmatales bacterium]